MLHVPFSPFFYFHFSSEGPSMHHFLPCNHISPAFHFQLRRGREMLPYVDTLYVSGTSSPAGQENIMISSTSSLVSPCRHPSASSFYWFPLSPLAFDQSLVFPVDDEAVHIVGEEFNASAEVAPPSDPAAADHRVEVHDAAAAGIGVAATLPEGRKTSGRKRFRTDRHSKIHTSQGLRDRRMRLSLDVARRFFDLQDMLGFDKASHTISWLLTQSKTAIEQLTSGSSPRANQQALNSPHSSFGSNDSSSEGEAVSPDLKAAEGFQPPGAVTLDAKSSRESRDKARARARKRTREKNKERTSCKGLLADACTLDYDQVLAPSKAAATDPNLEECAPWDDIMENSPVSMMPSWVLCNNHEAVSLLEEQLKIADSGNKQEDMFISWLM